MYRVNKLLNPRAWFLFSALACAGLLAWGLYKQHVDFVDPSSFISEEDAA